MKPDKTAEEDTNPDEEDPKLYSPLREADRPDPRLGTKRGEIMNELEKQLYLQEQCNKIKGSIVTKLKTRIIGEQVILETITLKHPNGDEFVMRPFDRQQLHVVQTLWG